MPKSSKRKTLKKVNKDFMKYMQKGMTFKKKKEYCKRTFETKEVQVALKCTSKSLDLKGDDGYKRAFKKSYIKSCILS